MSTYLDVIKIIPWCFTKLKNLMTPKTCLILSFLLVSSFIFMVKEWYPYYVADKKVENLIQEYLKLGINLNAVPKCNSDVSKSYNQARTLYTLIASYAPYTSRPAMYQIFLDTNKPIVLPMICVM